MKQRPIGYGLAAQIPSPATDPYPDGSATINTFAPVVKGRPYSPRWRRRLGVLITALVATAAALVLPLATPAQAYPAPDPYQAYVQAGCLNPVEQPGVVAFRSMLIDRYGIGGGIFACSGYEHGEGRALDWMVNHFDPAQDAMANEVLNWLLATDADGYPHAMARRLGIGNIIWNGQSIELWSYNSNKVWEPYTPCVPGSPPGVCHTNHIHIAFSWAGARQQTSWFTTSPRPSDWYPGGGGGQPSNAFAAAFQANTGNLWTAGTAGVSDWGQGMAPNTSPSITGLASGGYEFAFQANTTNLITMGNGGNHNWGLGMMAGTSPSIAGLSGGGFQVAFQANSGHLWTVGDAGNRDWGLGMKAGTSPSITALPGGGFQVAFQANSSRLWTVGDAGNRDWGLGMKAGTSPSITALPGGGFEVAFQANTGNLWTAGTADVTDWGQGMAPNTSPSITALAGGGYEFAFQANTAELITMGAAGNSNWHLGMTAGTSPSITALPGGGFEVAFQANTTNLWTIGDAGWKDWGLGMKPGTSPAIARY